MPTPRKALSLFPEDSETGSATVRPPLKWAGGKRWQVSELRCYWGQEGHRRFNRSGEFNVPFGRYTNIRYRSDFLEYREVFASWKFMNVDFEKLPLRSDDFVYADPPYDVEFRQYSKDGFGWDEQERTAEWLACHPGPVGLSNQATPRIVQLYRKLGFGLRFLHAPRRISCNGDRTPAEEDPAIRNLPQ